MGNICEAFPAFACRIRSLEVRIPMRHFEPFVHLPKSSFPWLEKLVLRFRDQHPFHVSEKLKSKYPHGIEIFSGSHQLKHVEFDEIGGDSLLKTILFPRDAVTTLMVGATSHLGTQFTGLYFDALRSMNKLVDCTIQFPGKQSDISSHADQPINLPFLQSLTLSASEEVDTGYDVAFFRCLYAPCLKYLWLSVGASENHGELVRQLASFRERSTVSLSSLTLSHFIVRPISGEDLISLVAVFPSISILRTTLTSGVLDTSPLMRALVYNPDHPGPLLPNLEELRLESTTVNGKDVWNLVRSYWCSNNSRLRMVDILFFTGGTDGGGPYAELEHESALHGIDLTIDLYVYDY
ncbi:hypothetical protein BDP27DRAFT_1310436 [Rhodocollybia butyracea]|uniref:Uncharacterized protein n=1 Tax=Rhodocollybia butyracea TaxID=206335 RepID=A0A9P5UGV8_9AGAR|nr:hypothetical protein BDP27DRAFT_1310436 [Rhodocollybia butyracea]